MTHDGVEVRAALSGERKHRENITSPGCFGFCWPFRSARAKQAKPSTRSSTVKPLPELHVACDAARKKRGTLAKRLAFVIAKLCPTCFCCTLDCCICFYRRPRGPKNLRSNTRRLRLALQDLGPAFVKAGQACSAREDVLSDEITIELRKLCDQVPPFSTAEAQILVQQELGAAAPYLPERPIAAGSLGQVYRVSMFEQEYALKIQRPGIAETIALDVVILQSFARFLNRVSARFVVASVDYVQVVTNWATTLWEELDYVHEARASEKVRVAICPRVKGLMIPPVCWPMTTTKVLSTAWVVGIAVTENPRAVTNRHINIGVESFAAMLLDMGVVHADPHPGNLLLTPDGGACLLDFGMTINVPPSHRKAWAACVVHLVLGDYEKTLDDLIEIGFFPRGCPRHEVLPVMSKIWAQLVASGSNIQKRKHAVKQLYGEIMTFVRRFKFDLPDYYVALARALLTLEGIALSADCEFDIFQAIFPVALRTVTAASSQAAQEAARRQLGNRYFVAFAALASFAALGVMAQWTVARLECV